MTPLAARFTTERHLGFDIWDAICAVEAISLKLRQDHGRELTIL